MNLSVTSVWRIEEKTKSILFKKSSRWPNLKTSTRVYKIPLTLNIWVLSSFDYKKSAERFFKKLSVSPFFITSGLVNTFANRTEL